MKKTICDITVEDVDKRQYPDKHYEYVIRVSWSDGTVSVVYRRYSRFYSLQCKLLDKFPADGGIYNPRDRILPFLPGKILFGRSHIRKVALSRLEPINAYCKKLVRLPTAISDCQEVLQFFEPCEEDLLPTNETSPSDVPLTKAENISDPIDLDQYTVVADYAKDGRNETKLMAGWIVEVVEKNDTGWWFVRTEEGQGWVPSSYLEKTDGSADDRLIPKPSKRGSKFVCTRTYLPQETDELKIDKGCFVEVVERNLDGWWLVRYKGQEGRAPATYLTRTDTLKAKRLMKINSHQAATQVVPNIRAVTTIANLQEKDVKPEVTNVGSRWREQQQQHKTGQHLQTKQTTNNDLRERINAASANKVNQGPKGRSIKPTNKVHQGPKGRSIKPENRQGPSTGLSDDSDDDLEYVNVDRPAGISQGAQFSADSISLGSSTSDASDSSPQRQRKLPPRKETLTRGIPPPTAVESIYVAIGDYENTVGDGISLYADEELSVIEKTELGWWLVKGRGGEGWAPSSYIEKQERFTVEQKCKPKPQRPPPPTQNRTPPTQNRTPPTQNRTPPTQNRTPKRPSEPDLLQDRGVKDAAVVSEISNVISKLNKTPHQKPTVGPFNTDRKQPTVGPFNTDHKQPTVGPFNTDRKPSGTTGLIKKHGATDKNGGLSNFVISPINGAIPKSGVNSSQPTTILTNKPAISHKPHGAIPKSGVNSSQPTTISHKPQLLHQNKPLVQHNTKPTLPTMAKPQLPGKPKPQLIGQKPQPIKQGVTLVSNNEGSVQKVDVSVTNIRKMFE